MLFTFAFFFNSIFLGVGLAMDAFSVSLANGLNAPCIKWKKMSLIAGTFALFQILMPLIGWFCVHNIARYFSVFQKFIPWIALVLLAFIGSNMLIEGLKNKEGECNEQTKALTFGGLIVQGIATSIDALSVGFTISNYNTIMAIVSCLIIGIVTFFICLGGIALGKKFGTKLAGKASILGGVILILIGIEIFLTGVIY
ncbi:MAG: manganese efflux pump [Clostridia bacterium]|nr:manganese efflux pump [Clostridia bacterium]